ncbi:MAG: PAS domain S-box protein [Lautropia sp.]
MRTALQVGGVYLVVGTLWILLSDSLVASISTQHAWLVTAQRFKGLIYVWLTTAGLTYLVYLGYRRLLAMHGRVVSSDLRVQDLFMHHPQPMWVHDPATGRILRVNDAAVAAYGYRRDELLAMDVSRIQPSRATASPHGSAQPKLAGLNPSGVSRHRTASGRTIIARTSEHRIELDGREAVMVMAEDVTEEVNLQQALQRQQWLFQQLHENLGEVLWTATPDCSRITYASRAFAEVYGRDPSQLRADPSLWLDAVHPDDRDDRLDILSLPPGIDSLEREYRILRPDGRVRWIQDRKRRVRDETGAVTMICGIAEDVTVRRERDEARDALNSSLEALVSERTRELRDAYLELDAFSRTAAHDLRSPLGGIVGMCTLLRGKCGDALDGQAGQYVSLIEDAARGMSSLVGDLLALSRAGNVELDRKVVDHAPAARAIFDELRMLEPERRVEQRIAARLDAYCDENLMRSVLRNLIANAWKFSAARHVATITVSIVATADASTLTVEDDGAGFDTSKVGELLQPFQRYHSQSQFQGTGLGLVTCQRIAHRHGGRLILKSAPGAGTRVSVVLPNEGVAGSTPGAGTAPGAVPALQHG